MKTFPMLTIILAMGCLLVAGCNKSEAVLTPSGKGFELDKTSDQSVKQADTNDVKVAIDRKGGFDGPVTVELSGLPAGVTVDGGSMHTIAAKDSSITLKLMASDAAAPTDKSAVTVRVSATVEGQNLAKQDIFNLKVKSRS